MSLYYSASQLGFFDTNIRGITLPDDAVLISKEEYANLMLAQEQGKIIRPDANGRPVAIFYNPNDDEKKEICKLAAKRALQESDWAELPSVSDPTRSPHLVNVDEFLSYRSELRKLTIFPQAEYVLPKCPDSIWRE